MYKSLNNSDKDLTGVLDSNSELRFSHNVASDFYSDVFSVNKEHKSITVEYQTTNFVGTGTLTWQHSADGIVWFDLIGSSRETVALAVDDSAGYFTTYNYPYGLHRMKWTAGTGGDATTGSIVLLLRG